MRVDTSKIGKGELLSLAAAAKIVGCHYEKLRRARNSGTLVVLATNAQMTTGSQLIRYIEDPLSVKAPSQIKKKSLESTHSAIKGTEQCRTT